MAEAGTAVEVKGGGTSGSEILSPAEHDAEYEAALKEDPAPKKEGGTDEGADDAGTEGGDEAAAPPKTEPDPAKVAAEKAEAEERELVKSLGLDEGVKIPKELVPHLKKVQGELGKLTNEVKRRGSQNKQVSEQYHAVQKELDAVKAQVNASPEARLTAIKEKLGKVDKSKLPEATQKLLADDDFLLTLVTATDMLSPAKAEEPASAPDGEVTAEALGLTPEVVDDLEKDHPDFAQVYSSQEFAAWANAQPKETLLSKMKTGAGHREVLAAFKEDFKKAVETADKMLSEEIAKVHPDFTKTFASPEFKEWIGKQSRSEQAKLRDTDPRGFIEVLNNFGNFKTAQEALAQRDAKLRKKNGSLTGIESVGGGVGRYEEMSEDDILNMSEADFKKLDQRVTTGGRR